jgi:hypothetical protein
MNKDFTLYSEALELKQLGFDEPCIAYYTVVPEENINWFTISEQAVTDSSNIFGSSKNYNTKWFETEGTISAPTYSQCFRWFREKHQLKCCIIPLVCGRGYSDLYESRIHQEKHSVSIIGNYKIYEEAELACLKELIEIVKNNHGSPII